EGVILGPPGYRALLFIASNYVLDGRYEDAITLAESVTLDNQDSALRLDADAVLADAIAAAPPGADIDLAVLYSAAEGTYYTKDFAKARDGFLLLLQRLPTSRQADEFGARAFYFLGRSYSYLDSPLEAAVTHQQGYELYPDDETHTSKNASSWMKAAERFRSAAPDDLVLDQFWKDAVDAVSSTSAGGAPDQAKWTAAQSDYSRAKDKAKEARGKEGSSAEGKAAILALDKAISGYKGIESGSRYYEQAAVQVGMCLFRKMDWDSAAGDQAFQAFDDYLTIFVQNPENNPQDARGRKMRSDSVAQADFYRGQVRYKQAQSGQASAWTEVLSLYDGFSERHESQRDYTAAAWVANIQAHLAGQNFEAATAQFDELNSSGFSDARVAQAAHYLFSFWENFGDTQSGQAKTDALSNAADYLSIANNRAKKQNWQNLLKEARLRMDIQQPANAATLLEKVLSQFENDSSFTERNQFFARMDLVDSYLAQFNTAQADPIIKELLVTRPNNLRVIQASVRVLCGWPTLKDGTVVEVPGVGTPEAHEQANTLLSTLTQLAAKEAEDSGVSKFEHAPYWEARAQMAYLLYQQSLVNSAFKGKHKTLVDSLQRLAPDLGEAAAGPDLRTILLWIQSR
ncbi:MAG: hypothetical protein MK213_03115, partial [Planctomycetes bacterium]|nr:hypothetical protein [Planctomycetota bacterium]